MRNKILSCTKTTIRNLRNKSYQIKFCTKPNMQNESTEPNLANHSTNPIRKKEYLNQEMKKKRPISYFGN